MCHRAAGKTLTFGERFTCRSRKFSGGNTPPESLQAKTRPWGSAMAGNLH
jgi:hypothetical protein